MPAGSYRIVARIKSPSARHLRIVCYASKGAALPVRMAYSEVFFPTKANAFPKVETNSFADCGRKARIRHVV